MKWFLDTNICISFLRGEFQAIAQALQLHEPKDIVLPAIVEAELLYGVEKSKQRSSNFKAVQEFIQPFEIVPFDKSCAQNYASIRSSLERKGQKIGPNDLLIAATVLTHHGTLVTHNLKEFSRVKGLILENWTEIEI
jgi:tRNA(fMet)-specific endonuclease VapC